MADPDRPRSRAVTKPLALPFAASSQAANAEDSRAKKTFEGTAYRLEVEKFQLRGHRNWIFKAWTMPATNRSTGEVTTNFI